MQQNFAWDMQPSMNVGRALNRSVRVGAIVAPKDGTWRLQMMAEAPAARPVLFTAYRPDGWPLCPACGEDELLSWISAEQQMQGAGIADYIAAGLRCLACGWEPGDAYIGPVPGHSSS